MTRIIKSGEREKRQFVSFFAMCSHMCAHFDGAFYLGILIMCHYLFMWNKIN